MDVSWMLGETTTLKCIFLGFRPPKKLTNMLPCWTVSWCPTKTLLPVAKLTKLRLQPKTSTIFTPLKLNKHGTKNQWQEERDSRLRKSTKIFSSFHVEPSGFFSIWRKPGTTLPKTNIAPGNRPSQKESSIPTINFQVRAVSFREGIFSRKKVTSKELAGDLGKVSVRSFLGAFQETLEKINWFWTSSTDISA